MNINRLELSLDELRPLVLEAFKNTPQSQYSNICSEVARIAVQKSLVQNPNQGHVVYGGSFELSSMDQERVREIIWDLVIERVVTIGYPSNPAWPFLKLTEYGAQVANSNHPTPHDPSGYLNRIINEVSNIDPVILTYLEESLRTYNVGALLSSTITLGCASEKALLILIEAFATSIRDQKRQEKFINDTNGRQMKRQYDVLMGNLNGIKGHLPGDISEGLDTVLLGVFEMIRNYRNEAGHPTGKSISREQAYANLQVFIPYCKKVYQLKEYFLTNGI